MVEATVMLVVSAASAGAGPSARPEVMVKIESSSQKEILDRGLKVLVSNKGGGAPNGRGPWLLQHLRRSGFHATDKGAGGPARGTAGFGAAPAPRAGDRGPGAGARQPGGPRADRPGADRPHRPLRRGPCPDRPDRRPYRRARPDLRRDRLQRDHAGEHRAHDPTGDQPGPPATATS